MKKLLILSISLSLLLLAWCWETDCDDLDKQIARENAYNDRIQSQSLERKEEIELKWVTRYFCEKDCITSLKYSKCVRSCITTLRE